MENPTIKLFKSKLLLFLLLLSLTGLKAEYNAYENASSQSHFFHFDYITEESSFESSILFGPRLENGAFFTSNKFGLKEPDTKGLADNHSFLYPFKKGSKDEEEGCCAELDGKPSQLTFTFVGGGCAVDGNSQDDKSECIGGVGTPSSASIRVVDKKDNVLFNDTVALGDTFTFGDASDKLESVIFIYINGTQEVNEVHASCSAPLVPGERFGSLQLEGLVSDDGEVCNESVSPPTSGGEDCCDEVDGKPSQLTFTFVGGGCAADGNSQDDKSECNGGVGMPTNAQIRVVDKKDKELFNGTVALGDTFTFGDPNEKLESVVFIYINGTQEVNEVHASCSAPLVSGERFGSLQLEGLVTDDGEVCNVTPSEPCEATITNNGCEPAVLWRLISKNKWEEPAKATIQPGDTYTFNVTDGHVWQVWNVKDDKQFGSDFVIDCDTNNEFSFVTPGCGSGGGGEDCCDEVDGKPAELVFQFLGGGCSADANSQDDKSECTGGVGMPASATIQVIDKKDNELFNGVVNLGDVFSFGEPGDKLESEIFIYINGNQEEIEVHASCSRPLITGERFGSLQLVSLTTEDGEVCGEIPVNCTLAVSAGPDVDECEPDEAITLTASVSGQNDCSINGNTLDPCEDKKENGKPVQLTFEFLGGGCAASNNSQGSDKFNCDGGVGTPASVSIRVLDKKQEVVLFSGIVDLNGEFTFGTIGDKLDSVTFIEINGGEELIEIHTSCSVPIILGERFGSLRLTGMVTDENKTFTFEPGDSSVNYVWTTADGNIVGDTNQATITVDQSGTYKVVAKDCEYCEAEDEIVVTLDEKVNIGDFVWNDVNQNGIQDAGETGVNGISVALYQCDNGQNGGGTLIDTTTTADDGTGNPGSYTFEVCPNSGDYYIVFGELPDGFEFTDSNIGDDRSIDSDANENGVTDCFEITDEDEPTIDTGIFVPNASLGDTVFNDEDQDGIQDDGEEGVAGVVVNLLDCEGNELATTTTDANGNYLFADLDPEVDYIVEFELPDGYEFSPADAGGDDALDSDAGADGRTPCTDLAPGENNPTLDAGIFVPRASLGDTVFNDEDQDGIQDDGEEGVEGVVVNLLDCEGNELATTTTDANGIYLFADLDPDVDYIVEFELPDGYEFSPADAGGDDAVDSDAGADGRTPCTDLAPGENNPTLDAGIFVPNASLGDTVFNDEDQDGIQDDGEEGVEGVVVNLLDCEGNELATTTTDANGNYLFADLDPEVDYIVEFELPDGYEFSPADAGGDDALDSDAGADGRTPCTDLTPGENNPTLDAGIFIPCDITPEVTSVDPICLGEEVTLIASGGDQYQWSADGAVIDGATAASLTVSPDETTVYSVLVTDTTKFECFGEVSITVTVNPLTPDETIEETVCEGDTFAYEGQEYAAGTYEFPQTDDNGCPYLITLVVDEYPATPDQTIEETVCEGATFTYEGEEYAAGTYEFPQTDDNGCPFVITLVVDEYPATPDQTIEETVCEGATFAYEGQEYAAGTYEFPQTDDNGCPYLITLVVDEYPATPDETIEETVCEGDTFAYEGEEYAAGTYEFPQTDDNGCPYLITLVVDEYPATPDETIEETVCEGDTFAYEGQEYAAGTYEFPQTDDNGCPYLITLVVDEYPATPDETIEETVCEGDTFAYEGQEYAAGTYEFPQTDDNGCPYLITLVVDEYPATPDETIEETVCEGDTFTYEGEEYAAGTYEFPQTDDNGCPYLITLVVDEYPATPDETVEGTVCEGDTFTYEGEEYAAGTYEFPQTDDNGCPYLITLVVDEYPATPDETVEGTVCEGDTFTYEGEEYAAGTYEFPQTDDNGCPYLITLVVDEYPATPDETVEGTVCEGDTFTYEGEEYAAGTYEFPQTDDNGCPYLITLVVDEYPATPDETVEGTVCEGDTFTYEGEEYAAGTYEFPQTDDNGCPYLITLVVEEFDPASVEAGEDETICEGDEVTLTATGDGTFMWFVDGSDDMIGMEASLTVSPEASTTYRVKVTTQDGCEAEDTVTVTVTEKVLIGDFVWEDTNENGIQDEGEPGVFGVTVELYQCIDGVNDGGVFVESMITNRFGLYQFEVCPNSGSYYIVFSDIPDGFEFTSQDSESDDSVDSDADAGGVTDCFEIFEEDDMTRDAGIINVDTCGAQLANKILPRDPPGIYQPRSADTACIGDDLYFWVFRDITQLQQYIDEDFTGWTFTFTFPNGDVFVQDSDNTALPHRIANLGLGEEDFGVYTVDYEDPTGCMSSYSFTLSLAGECLEDGTRPSESDDRVAQLSPNPATTGGVVNIAINTRNGSVTTATNGTLLQARSFTSRTVTINVALYDMSGRLVAAARPYQVNPGRAVINYQLGGLETGTYMVQVIGDGWNDTAKLIVR